MKKNKNFLTECIVKIFKITNARILMIVNDTDLVSPGDSFRRVAPLIHNCPEALEHVNRYGNLTRVYCEELVKRFEGDFPWEIERTIINLEGSNLIYYLTDAGHTWSERACALMKKRHPMPYHNNVENKIAK